LGPASPGPRRCAKGYRRPGPPKCRAWLRPAPKPPPVRTATVSCPPWADRPSAASLLRALMGAIFSAPARSRSPFPTARPTPLPPPWVGEGPDSGNPRVSTAARPAETLSRGGRATRRSRARRRPGSPVKNPRVEPLVGLVVRRRRPGRAGFRGRPASRRAGLGGHALRGPWRGRRLERPAAVSIPGGPPSTIRRSRATPWLRRRRRQSGRRQLGSRHESAKRTVACGHETPGSNGYGPPLPSVGPSPQDPPAERRNAEFRTAGPSASCLPEADHNENRGLAGHGPRTGRPPRSRQYHLAGRPRLHPPHDSAPRKSRTSYTRGDLSRPRRCLRSRTPTHSPPAWPRGRGPARTRPAPRFPWLPFSLLWTTPPCTRPTGGGPVDPRCRDRRMATQTGRLGPRPRAPSSVGGPSFLAASSVRPWWGGKGWVVFFVCVWFCVFVSFVVFLFFLGVFSFPPFCSHPPFVWVLCFCFVFFSFVFLFPFFFFFLFSSVVFLWRFCCFVVFCGYLFVRFGKGILGLLKVCDSWVELGCIFFGCFFFGCVVSFFWFGVACPRFFGRRIGCYCFGWVFIIIGVFLFLWGVVVVPVCVVLCCVV